MTPKIKGAIHKSFLWLWPLLFCYVTLLQKNGGVQAQEIKSKYWQILQPYPQGGFHAQLSVPVTKDTTVGWTINLNFENVKLSSLRGFIVSVKEVRGMEGHMYQLSSKGFNGQLTKGQTLKIDLRGTADDPNLLPTDENSPLIDFQGVTYDGSQSEMDDTLLLLEEISANEVNQVHQLDPTKFDLDMYQLEMLLEKSLYFLDAQRSGPVSKEDRYKVFWRGDSALLDGSDIGIDLTGGFYVGGDHIKFNYAIAHMVTILSWSVKRHKDVYYHTMAANGDKLLDSTYKILKWGADYLMKCHPDPTLIVAQIGNPATEHKEWMRAEEIDLRDLDRKTILLNKGVDAAQDIAAEMSAALAAFSIVARGDQSYYLNLVDKAKSLYDFAVKSPGEYDTNDHMKSVQNHYKSLSALDELVWAEIWIFIATSEQAYLESAINNINSNRELKFEIPEEFSYDDKRAGIHAILSQYTKLYPDHENSMKIAKSFCNKFLPNGNFAITEEGMPLIDNWNNLGLASGMSMICIYMAESLEAVDESIAVNYYHLAKNVVAFAAGSSGQSYIVGYSHPKYGVRESPEKVHHRSSSCPIFEFGEMMPLFYFLSANFN